LVAVKTIMPCDTKRAKGYKPFLTLKDLQHEKGHDEQITRIITMKRTQVIHQINIQFVTTNANKIITITTTPMHRIKYLCRKQPILTTTHQGSRNRKVTYAPFTI
jgi:hypothetical protein